MKKRVDHDAKMKKVFNEHLGVIERYDKQIAQGKRNIMKKHSKKVNCSVEGIECERTKAMTVTRW